MAGRLCRATWLRRPAEPRHKKACHDKSKQAHQQPLPMTARDEIETSQCNARSQQQAAEEPKRWLPGREAFANCPPKAAEEYCAEQEARHQGQSQAQSLIHQYSPVPLASPCLLYPPSARHSNRDHTSELQSLRHLV